MFLRVASGGSVECTPPAGRVGADNDANEDDDGRDGECSAAADLHRR